MGRGLVEILEQKKAAIAKDWFNHAIIAYAPETAEFLKSKTDSFANPVGSATLNGIRVLLDQLIKGMDQNTISAYLDPIIRIRAVQNFTPSQATAFILSLKNVLRDHLAKEIQDTRIADELFEFESKIDHLCLVAFDIYMQCREKIYQIRANETRNRHLEHLKEPGLFRSNRIRMRISENH